MEGLKKGDWVVFGKGQSGTWSSRQILEEEDVIKLTRVFSDPLVGLVDHHLCLHLSNPILEIPGRSVNFRLIKNRDLLPYDRRDQRQAKGTPKS